MYVSGCWQGFSTSGNKDGCTTRRTSPSAPLASGYFTDAKILGVRPGDIFFFVQEATSVPSSQMLRLNVVSQVTSDGAAFSTASNIQGTFVTLAQQARGASQRGLAFSHVYFLEMNRWPIRTKPAAAPQPPSLAEAQLTRGINRQPAAPVASPAAEKEGPSMFSAQND